MHFGDYSFVEQTLRTGRRKKVVFVELEILKGEKEGDFSSCKKECKSNDKRKVKSKGMGPAEVKKECKGASLAKKDGRLNKKACVGMGSTLLYTYIHIYMRGPPLPRTAPTQSPFNEIKCVAAWVISGAGACNRVSFRVIMWVAERMGNYSLYVHRFPLLVAVLAPRRIIIGSPACRQFPNVCPNGRIPCIGSTKASASSFRSRQILPRGRIQLQF